jgi:hypothetical protein
MLMQGFASKCKVRRRKGEDIKTTFLVGVLGDLWYDFV